MVCFYSLIHEGKNIVSGFVEFDEDINSTKDAQKAFDNLLKSLSENHKTDFTRDNCALVSFSKL